MGGVVLPHAAADARSKHGLKRAGERCGVRRQRRCCISLILGPFAALVLMSCSNVSTGPPTLSAPEDASVAVPMQGRASPEVEHLVTYVGHTFTPQHLNIPAGAVVTFSNTSNVPVWPASNIHPTHAILPSFDPLRAIPPAASWSYRFEVPGYWRYHNHLAPGEVGIVVVVSVTGGSEIIPITNSLPAPQFPDFPTAGAPEYDLYDDLDLRAFLRLYGPTQVVTALHEDEVSTGRPCHGRAHVAGRMAYEEFGPATVTIIVHECQSGLSHGTIEAMFAERGTDRLHEDIRSVCSYTTDPFIRHQCMHGIGHGLMAWTSYELHEALALCDSADEYSDQASCQSGVFMENVVGGLAGSMGHTSAYIRPDDPHFPCTVVHDRYIDQCYYYQTSHMVTVFAGDLQKVAAACLEAPPSSAQIHCFGSFGRDISAIHNQDPVSSIAGCQFAPKGALQSACISGAVQDGFWDISGWPRAQQFCSLLADNTAEQSACYETIISRASSVISSESDGEAFCRRLPTRWQADCP